MAKKKKGPVLQAWCWYCDREFEDEKVLLQHQRAKHYRCPLCPRRLNTAGGLAVHLQQVHKAEPDRIENTLPGRDSFEIEIYGMEGIPQADLEEWKARKAASLDGSGATGGLNRPSKKPKVEKKVISAETLRAQLEAHKALMAGKAPPPGSLSALAVMGPPPTLTGPPPPFPMVPPPMFSGPPPGFPPPAAAGPPATPASAPAVPPQPSPHQRAIKAGVKSRIVFSDSALSPEERLARTPKYAYVEPADPQQSAAPGSPSVAGQKRARAADLF